MRNNIAKSKTVRKGISLKKNYVATVWRSYPELILLFIFCTLIFFSHALYVLKTHQYPAWDEHLFLQYTIKFYDILSHPSPDMFLKLGNVITDRQPMYPFSMVLPLLIFGTAYTYKIGLFLNGVYYIGTIIAIYFLAKEFVTKQASLIAAVLFGCYGFPLFYLHFTYSETAATCFVALALCFLAKSKYLIERKFTLLFSLMVALAGLTRWTTPVFIIGPFLYSLSLGAYLVIKKQKKMKRAFLINIAILTFIAFILPVCIYYLPKFSYFEFYVTHTSANSANWVSTINYLSPELKNTFSTRSIMFYFNILSEQTIYLFTLFVLGCLLALKHSKKYGFLLLAFFVPYSFFTFIVVFKDDRFIVPLYPAMAVLSSVLIAHVQNKLMRMLLVISVVFISMLVLLGGSWGVGPMGKQGLKDVVLPSFIHHPRRIYLTSMVWPPQKDIMNGQVFVSTIENDFGKHKKSPKILMTFRDIRFDQIYSIYSYEKREDYDISFQQIRGLNDKSYGAMFKSIQQADYISVKSKHTNEPGFNDPMVVRFNSVISLPNAYLPSGFIVLKKITIPYDKSTIIIYKRAKEISKEEIEEFSKLFIERFPDDEEKITLAVEKL